MKPYYEQGGITLYHGDCREVLPTLPRKSVDLVLTDPPYNAGFDYGPLVNDKRPWPDYYDDLIVVINEAERIANGPVFVFLSVTAMIGMPRKPRWIACWTRQSGAKQSGNNGFFPSWEPCLVYGKTWGESGRVPGWAMHDVWAVPAAATNRHHPCPKPLALFSKILTHCSGTVLDPFMGSGTTLRAAKDAGLKAIGIEINEAYCEIAARRLSQEVFPWGEMPLAPAVPPG